MSLPSTTMAQSRFAQVPPLPSMRSMFDRSHGLKTAIDAGKIYPILVDEILPGDSVVMNPEFFGRFATLEVPLLDNVYMDVQWFFVPMRLLWENFQKFMGEVEPGDTTEYTIPVFQDATTFAEDSLGDFLGLPVGVALDGVNCLPFRAVNRIYNEWYRDQNLQDSVVLNLDDGPDDIADYAILPRGKRHDYFTSSLPWPVRGGVEVPLPLGTVANLVQTAAAVQSAGTGIPKFTYAGSGGARELEVASAGTNVQVPAAANGGGPHDLSWSAPELEIDLTSITVDLSNATAATINDLRETIALQQLLEREARGGARYIELVYSAFRVTSSDSRLQRAEFLGGGTVMLQVNQVAATAYNPTANKSVGDLSAFGTFSMGGRGFQKSFEEHGYLLGFVSVRADLTYQEGLDRMWSRQTKYDFPWPEFMNLGEQEVLSKEIFADGSAGDEDIFGYQERYAEWRYARSRVTSVMRSTHSTSLDVWHLAQEFGTRPTLDATFIEEDPPISRVIKASSDAQVLLDCFFRYRHVRPLPTFSVPGLSRF